MIRPSRYIRARVVDFAKIDFAGDDFAGDDLAGPKRKLTPKQRQIRLKLRKAFRLKKRISHLKIRQPAGWMGAVRNLKKELRVVMSDLKQLGWRPKKARRPLKPGEDEMDAALDDIPDSDPGEDDEEGELDEFPSDREFEGNWLDGYVGVGREPRAKKPKKPRKNLFEEAGKLFKPKWGPAKPLGEDARIQAKPGTTAMVATVSPGLFIVQIVSDAAAKKIAGDNVGILPLLLYPMVKDKLQKELAPKPARRAPAPAAAPATPAAAGLGCDDCRG